MIIYDTLLQYIVHLSNVLFYILSVLPTYKYFFPFILTIFLLYFLIFVCFFFPYNHFMLLSELQYMIEQPSNNLLLCHSINFSFFLEIFSRNSLFHHHIYLISIILPLILPRTFLFLQFLLFLLPFTISYLFLHSGSIPPIWLPIPNFIIFVDF